MQDIQMQMPRILKKNVIIQATHGGAKCCADFRTTFEVADCFSSDGSMEEKNMHRPEAWENLELREMVSKDTRSASESSSFLWTVVHGKVVEETKTGLF